MNVLTNKTILEKLLKRKTLELYWAFKNKKEMLIYQNHYWIDVLY